MNVFVLAILFVFVNSEKCNILKTEKGFVCACNSTYCDTVPNIEPQNLENGKYQAFSTSKTNPGFNVHDGVFEEESDPGRISLIIDQDSFHQNVIGFGGAFTDSTGMNIKSLPEEAQRLLLKSYFGDEGIEYSLCRVPIGGTDFSPRPYSYADAKNENLENFELQEEDLNYKIPFIQKAKDLRGNRTLNLFASAWTAPPWMKTTNNWSGIGFLKKEYYQTWAFYTLKFFQEYNKKGIRFWGLTTGNEPLNGWIPTPLNSMGWSVGSLIDWVGQNLGPTIRGSDFKDLKIMIFDDNRIVMPVLPLVINSKVIQKYADGVAFHWYHNQITPYSWLRNTKSNIPEWFTISSEACNGFLHIAGLEKPVELGSWERGEKYAKDIILDFKEGVSGWVDWNMVLDLEGGPCYINNNVDSPIIVNKTGQEFYKQPMYYTLGHFSKFVIPNSKRLDTNNLPKGIYALSFKRPDNIIVVIILNTNKKETKLQIKASTKRFANLNLEARSITSMIFK